MDAVTQVRVKNADGTFGDPVPVGASARNLIAESGVNLPTVHSEIAEAIYMLSASFLLKERVDRLQNTMGSEDISEVGRSVTNAINELHSDIQSTNSNLAGVSTSVTNLRSQVGSEDISEVGTSVTNAINELDQNHKDLQDVVSKMYGKCLIVNFGSVNGESGNLLSQTKYSDEITEDMVVVESTLGNPSAQTGDWTVTTTNGSVTVNGSISGSTTLEIRLVHSKIADVT